MNKVILVATDFSVAGFNASKYAAEMALSINADIYLMHMYQLPFTYGDVPMQPGMTDDCRDCEEDINDLKEILLKLTNRKIVIHTEVVSGVCFYDELKSLCEKLNPYSVVMGCQGTTATVHLLFGSHTAYAMEHLMWPLVTVPPYASFTAIKKIGMACDLNKVVDSVPLEEINILVRDFKASLHILVIDKQEGFNPVTDFESVLLEELMADLKADFEFITNKNIDEAIISFTERNKIDLLIVVPKRYNLLSKLLHKSHTKNLVLHSHVPVMILHQ